MTFAGVTTPDSTLAQTARVSGNQDRGVTAADFFHRFPELAPFLLAELKEATHSQTDLHPSLVSTPRAGAVTAHALARTSRDHYNGRKYCVNCASPSAFSHYHFGQHHLRRLIKAPSLSAPKSGCIFLAVWAVMVAFMPWSQCHTLSPPPPSPSPNTHRRAPLPVFHRPSPLYIAP